MCCYTNKAGRTKVEKKFKKGKRTYIWCYKVLCNWDNRLSSPYYPQEYKPGPNIANGCHLTRQHIMIRYGIHVFLSRKDAEAVLDTRRIIVKVRCYQSDFIGAEAFPDGGVTAVFTSVELPKSEYKRACNILEIKQDTTKGNKC